jgi:hypothetical protein
MFPSKRSISFFGLERIDFIKQDAVAGMKIYGDRYKRTRK